MIEWKVACLWNDEEKRGYMPHDSIQMCLSLALWIGEIGDHDLVIFIGTESNCFSLQNRLLWEIIVSKKKPWSKRRMQAPIHCGNYAGRSEYSYTRKEVKLKPFSLPNTLLRPTAILHFQSIVLGIRKQRQS